MMNALMVCIHIKLRIGRRERSITIRQEIIAYNHNNMRNPSLYFISWGYACCYCCMQLSFVCIILCTIHLCGSLNSELQTIYASIVYDS